MVENKLNKNLIIPSVIHGLSIVINIIEYFIFFLMLINPKRNCQVRFLSNNISTRTVAIYADTSKMPFDFNYRF